MLPKQTNKQTNKHSNAATLAETRDAPCGPTGTPPDGCKDTMIYDFPVVVAGCTILVDYKLRKCPDGFSISEMSPEYTNSTQCDVFIDHFLSLYNQGNFLLLSSQMNQLYSVIMTKIEKHELDKYTLPYCDENYHINTQIFAASCLQLCLSEDERGNPYVYQAQCGNGCCSRYSIYCLDRETNATRIFHQNGPTPVCAPYEVCDNQTCSVNCDRIRYTDVFDGF